MNRNFVKKLPMPETLSATFINSRSPSRLQTPSEIFFTPANNRFVSPSCRDFSSQSETCVIDTSNLRTMKFGKPVSAKAEIYGLESSKLAADGEEDNAHAARTLFPSSSRLIVAEFSPSLDTRNRYLDRTLGHIMRGSTCLKSRTSKNGSKTSDSYSAFHGARSERQQKSEILCGDVKVRSR